MVKSLQHKKPYQKASRDRRFCMKNEAEYTRSEGKEKEEEGNEHIIIKPNRSQHTEAVCVMKIILLEVNSPSSSPLEKLSGERTNGAAAPRWNGLVQFNFLSHFFFFFFSNYFSRVVARALGPEGWYQSISLERAQADTHTHTQHVTILASC